MITARATYLLTLAALISWFLYEAYSVPGYHTGVFYIALYLALLVVGSIGSALLRPWWLNGLLLGVIWPLIYLLVAIKHGFLWSDFASHSASSLVLFIIPSAVDAGGSTLFRHIRRNRRAAA